MNLVDIVKTIDELDDDLIIFISDINDVKSDVVLYPEEENIGVSVVLDGVQYQYLLEVFIMKELIEDNCKYANNPPNPEEMAKIVCRYAINDA